MGLLVEGDESNTFSLNPIKKKEWDGSFVNGATFLLKLIPKLIKIKVSPCSPHV